MPLLMVVLLVLLLLLFLLLLLLYCEVSILECCLVAQMTNRSTFFSELRQVLFNRVEQNGCSTQSYRK